MGKSHITVKIPEGPGQMQITLFEISEVMQGTIQGGDEYMSRRVYRVKNKSEVIRIGTSPKCTI